MRLHKAFLIVCCLASPLLAQNEPRLIGTGQKESLLIGPGDELHVQVFDTPNLDEDARVTDQGDLPLLLGGSIRVGSLTPEEAARSIEQSFIRGGLMNHPRVLVTVKEFGTENVTVFGQVTRPGAFTIDTPRAVVDVLALAGGLTDLADRHVIIERHATDQRVSYYVSNETDSASTRPVLVYPGDRVVVPKAGIIYVLGDVGKPGGFPMTNNESKMTVLQAIATAGGTQTSAVPSHARLIRRSPDAGSYEMPLPLSAMQKGKKQDIAMQPGDIIYVPFSYIRNAALGLTGIAASAASAAIYTK